MSIFEIIMLLCFGLAWPFSIAKSWTARSNKGKSFMFLFTALIGYIAGIIHKSLYSPDPVIYLYIMNGALILADIMIFFRNSHFDKKRR